MTTPFTFIAFFWAFMLLFSHRIPSFSSFSSFFLIVKVIRGEWNLLCVEDILMSVEIRIFTFSSTTKKKKKKKE